jgi:hypothetical protein
MISVTVDIADLEKEVNEAIEAQIRYIVMQLTAIGEDYIIEGRRQKGGDNGDYNDQTGNLRNAHSYIIYVNGLPVLQQTGRPETLEMFEKLKDRSEMIQLIVGDGMEYASFVEGKGYNVCSSAFLGVERRVREVFKN